MSNEQTPSAADIDIANEIEEAVEDACGVAFRPYERKAVALIVARVRRESRREALEEAAKACLRTPFGFYTNTSDLRPAFSVLIRAMAQKEAPRE